MSKPGDANDPKGLIREAYLIEGITLSECRSIFMDWALSLSMPDPHAAIDTLLTRHGAGQDDHPMTEVLRDGLARPPVAKRRGGRSGRIAQPRNPTL
ncbi:hypothetical protein E2K80_07215 [Rhodophyticola sp. CCM32]|uniref:hypothetical protein n=1 Tax=Rhodophyticola sp. CCM32 TaxID=2916397 RepID=UPI00107FA88E|nr:hypothetical protein [Rhodophyticola sp. CCM32]QBY00553.1 hypothetical protein E2K80_07215 [Rhodophyticola sp. CCM32]